MIKRLHSGARMSQIVIHNQVVHLAGQVDETEQGGPADEQTRHILSQIDALLAEAGTNKSKLLTATIYLTNMKDFGLMNQAWEAWVDSANPPTRATVGGVQLAGDEFTVEIVVSAAL
ncbi:Enamine deaminase RidA, house cleaning of reactive enamine intermediates, YjgF/YER057c/UK114 family [Thiothrix eikelboomii]|uniref:Enamine deaminase RidA, house cleaning of reactive enamine intermediates, YjgF/YER057c/UK114 family n=1 Tax=Thiothrix eikelboomii TaxID=92487 RepID=A0A1T4XVF9_9GAMM|nr:RidA family protein [Thiothrix eikelboomii]SKA93494.1 Enamine deaminase RidA, house cleaning of reactive enamine intermediates, YjgF/YER057c/UK114 family [Thiothrix eikelboomii]